MVPCIGVLEYVLEGGGVANLVKVELIQDIDEISNSNANKSLRF